MILFEDNHLLFVNKRAGLLTQPTEASTTSLEEEIKAYLKTREQKQGNVFLHAIHRLDRPASGVVLFAKTSKALSRLNEALRNKKIEKYYLAIIEGIMSSEKDTLIHYLTHDDHVAKIVPKQHPEAKLCELRYEVLQHNYEKSLLGIELKTGRYHQIRAQLAATGHPILGDKKYGSTTLFPEQAICLHHARMTVPHPITQELLVVEAPMPLFWQVPKWR